MTFKNLFPLAALSLAAFSSACTPLTYPPRTECTPRQPWDEQHGCTTQYFNSDGSTQSMTRDLITDLAQAEEILLASQARHYASQFSLSEEQGMKIARTVSDYAAIQNRSEADIADFAQRLYGVSPSRIVAAVGAAQIGNHAALDDVIAEAAENFETTPAVMKAIINDLHGQLLQQQGIRF